MPLGVNAHPGAWLDGVAVAGQDLRLQLAGAMLTGATPSGSTGIAARPGVRNGTGSPLLVQASSGMNISVNAGVAFVQGTASATAGMYTCCLDTTSTITVATSDPTNPRIDNVICQITDVGTSGSTTVVTLQTGTPAPSPVAPTLPANSLLLATVAVAANAASITGANITDKRVFTAATGGIVPLANTTGGISGAAGMYAHDLSTGRLRVSDGSGNARAPKVAAITPVLSQPAGTVNVTSNSAYTVLTSAVVAVDGATELEVSGTWADVRYVSGTAAAGDGLVTGFSTVSNSLNWTGAYNFSWNLYTYGQQRGNGGSFRSWITPAAGTVTIYWLGLLNQPAVYGFDTPSLRVHASTQS